MRKQWNQNKNYMWRGFNLRQQGVLRSSFYWLLNANPAFLMLFPVRDHHRFDHDHFKHQCPALLAQSVLCHGHGLVHSCVLCFRLLCSYWVCSCQLLHQPSDPKGQKTDTGPTPGDHIHSKGTLGGWNDLGNCLFSSSYPPHRKGNVICQMDSDHKQSNSVKSSISWTRVTLA